MRVLVLNGSPRKTGTVATLLRSLVRPVSEGLDVDWVDVYDLKMGFCGGCMGCRSAGECLLAEDDAHRVGRKIRQADALVVGTPTHWGHMSAALKLLFDRNISAFLRAGPRGTAFPVKKGRPAAIVAACGTDWPENVLFGHSRGAVNAVRDILRAGGYRVLGSVVRTGTRSVVRIPPALLLKAERLGRLVAESFIP
jgi:NAD(P)H-dependent FMN reductase